MRAGKTGLDYFPLDVDFFEDEKIEFVSARFGIKGEIIAVKLLCRLYRNNYYMPWGEDESMLFAKRAGEGITPALVNEVVQELVKREFFDKLLLDRFQILTSKGIQARYFEITKRRKPFDVIKEYILIDVDILPQNVNILSLNVRDGTQSKVKESKVKESKVKESKGNAQSAVILPFDSENFQKQWNLWREYKSKEHRFQYKTPQSEQAALNQLVKLGGEREDVCIAIIHQSMANGWKGFFELKNQSHGNKKFDPDRVSRALEKYN